MCSQSLQGDRIAWVALTGDGTVVAWGSNDSGQLDIPDDLGTVLFMDAGYKSTVILHTSESDLPEGLSMSDSGLISGTPVAGSGQFIDFRVIDALKRVGGKPLLLKINAQLPPTISSLIPDGPFVEMGEFVSIDFSVDAYDPEGRNLVYRWSWDGADVGTDLSAYTHSSDWGDAGDHLLTGFPACRTVRFPSTLFPAARIRFTRQIT